MTAWCKISQFFDENPWRNKSWKLDILVLFFRKRIVQWKGSQCNRKNVPFFFLRKVSLKGSKQIISFFLFSTFHLGCHLRPQNFCQNLCRIWWGNFNHKIRHLKWNAEMVYKHTILNILNNFLSCEISRLKWYLGIFENIQKGNWSNFIWDRSAQYCPKPEA